MDTFVKRVALVTLVLLAIIFANAFIGVRLGKDLGGLDDRVETMAVEQHRLEPRPVLELPGDSEVGAFTVAALGMGMIIGYSWRKMFGEAEGNS